MFALKTICFVGQLVHKACLEAIFKNSQVASVIVSGPSLTPCTFLGDPKEYARKLNIPVLDSADVSRERLIEIAVQTDVGISLGCSRVLRNRELNAPRLGTFNLHPSALPKYRGRHPCLYAIMEGQKTVGITLHRMDAGIDTGPIVSQMTEALSPSDDIVSLTDSIYSRGALLLEEFLAELSANGKISEVIQPKSIDPLEDMRVIDWRDSAWRINNLVRALTFPWPMAKTYFQGEPLLVSKTRVVEDGLVNSGLVLDVQDNAIRVGTGGHSIDILELRDEHRQIISLEQFVGTFQHIPGVSHYGNHA
jgi:methionyl-tRNA formyltransferase